MTENGVEKDKDTIGGNVVCPYTMKWVNETILDKKTERTMKVPKLIYGYCFKEKCGAYDVKQKKCRRK